MTTDERLRRATFAITGEVVAVRVLRSQDGFGDHYEAKVRVSRVYEGMTGLALRGRGSTAEETCGFGELRVGQRLGLLLEGRRSPWAIGPTSGISRAELERRTGGRSHRPGTR